MVDGLRAMGRKQTFVGGAFLLILQLALCCNTGALAKELTPQRHGYEQGKEAGRREGRERAGDSGGHDGDYNGYADGVKYGQQLLIDRAYQDGYSRGQIEGAEVGRQQGQVSGDERGRAKGEEEGKIQAKSDADKAALKVVAEPAAAAGHQRASLAKPTDDGRRDGQDAGGKRARAEALAKDYPKARKDYSNRQFATPPKVQESVRQAPMAQDITIPWSLVGLGREMSFGRPSSPSPDYRYLRYGSDSEDYRRGYRDGYAKGVGEGFRDEYDHQYRYSYDRAYERGTSQARVSNLQDTVNKAYEKGFAESHKLAFQQGEQEAYTRTYSLAHSAAYSAAYQEVFPIYQAEHFKAVEQASFKAIYDPPYQTAFQVAEQNAFEQRYPLEAKATYDRGWKDEAQDFVERPVRLLKAWLSPTDVEGVKLVTIIVRNFSSEPIDGNKLRVSLGLEASRFYRSLPPQSQVTVTGILRVRGEDPGKTELTLVYDNGQKTLLLGKVTLLLEEKI